MKQVDNFYRLRTRARCAVPLQNHFEIANKKTKYIISKYSLMKNKTPNNKRRSIRLKGYDYSSSGFYFITICTWKHLHLFGEIEDDQMVINRNGEIAKKEWYRTAELRKNIKLHDFIIMPNHLHGIIEIVNRLDVYCRGTAHRALVTEHHTPIKEQFKKSSSNTIPTIIRS